jgi:hypothetical protein
LGHADLVDLPFHARRRAGAATGAAYRDSREYRLDLLLAIDAERGQSRLADPDTGWFSRFASR